MRLAFDPILVLILFLINLFAVSSKGVAYEFINLRDSEECKIEINQHCFKEINGTNSKLMNCLQSSKEIIKSLRSQCQHFIWDYKNKYLDLNFFKYITNGECDLELSQFTNCPGTNSDEKVICIIKHKSMITNQICLSHLNEVAAVVFSDILVIHRFLGSCSDKIRELKCGRLEGDLKKFSTDNFISRMTSQGGTIECLIESLNKVDEQCKKQILRLGELQSDDFHLNPNLYFACRSERESLCGTVEAGRSRVYRCLESRKYHNLMSSQCRNALNQKNKLEAHDYKIRSYFSDKCTNDIIKHKCVPSSNETEITELSTILLCLLQAERKNNLSLDCRSQVLSARTQMAGNIEMFPEFKKNCENEIRTFCSEIQPNKDSIIHCLMRNSMPALENKFNLQCLKSLKNFVRIVDPTEDVGELDPVIMQVCSKELEVQCSSKNYVEPNDRYECLLQLIDDDRVQLHLSDDCKSHLLTLARFVEQEYSLNHKLFKMCHDDAVMYCGAKENSLQNNPGVVPHAIIHCLVRKWSSQYTNREKSTISYKCSSELKTVMKIEASNLMLNFKVYTACALDLTTFCRTVPHKMDCLQINYRKLKNSCKQSISDFLSLDSEEYSLKKLIARSCSPMVKLFCNEELTEKKRDYMECLLRHKLDNTMDKYCKIALEHYQIIGLDNYKIDHKFARFCSKEIQQFCSNLLPSSRKRIEGEIEEETSQPPQVTKSQIVSCLSKKLTLSLLSNENPFSSQCYEQFTFEFIQQTSSINFDPELRSVCNGDIEKFCSKQDPESILSCLYQHQDSLSEACINLLVSRQKLSSYDVKLDAGIQRYCPSMIGLYCSTVSSHKVFRCLHKNMRIEGFDAECKKKIINRLERRLVDLRLNSELIDDCKKEIEINCNVSKSTARIADMHFKDKHHIINCLRYVYIEHRKFLAGNCRRQVFEIVLDAQSNIHLDPGLYDVCRAEISEMCHESLIEHNVQANGQVQNCLKHNLLSEKIHNDKCNKEVYRLLREGLADIHVDPQLYAACRKEISQICQSELLGQGRKLSCLLWALENKSTISFISEGCKTILHDRKEMWEFATRMEAPRSVNEVLRLVAESESRYYFLMVFTIPPILILLVGILCGKYCVRSARKTIRKRR